MQLLLVTITTNVDMAVVTSARVVGTDGIDDQCIGGSVDVVFAVRSIDILMRVGYFCYLNIVLLPNH